MSETRLPGWAYRTRTRKCRFDPARSALVSSGRPRKVSGTKMLCKPKEFARDYKKPTFPSSSPPTPATQSGLRRSIASARVRDLQCLTELGLILLADLLNGQNQQWPPPARDPGRQNPQVYDPAGRAAALKCMKDIAEWLASLDLGEYAQRFAEDAIDLSVIRDL